MKKFLLFAALLAGTLTAGAQEDLYVRVTDRVLNDGRVVFSLETNVPGSRAVRVLFSQLENAAAPELRNGAAEWRGTVDAPGDFLVISPLAARRPVDYEYTWEAVMGTYNLPADEDFLYRLPYAEGVGRRVTRPSNSLYAPGKGEPAANYAYLCFDLAQNDTVYPMRKGTVVVIRDAADHVDGHCEIITQHADGTNAIYGPLLRESVRVVPGQTVSPVQPLGTIAPHADGYRLDAAVYHTVPVTQPDSRTQNWFCIKSFIDPIFMTSKGATRLTDGKKYKAAVPDSLINRELARTPCRCGSGK